MEAQNLGQVGRTTQPAPTLTHNTQQAYSDPESEHNGRAGDCSDDCVRRYYPSDGVPIAAPAAAQPHQWLRLPQGLRDRAQWCVAGADKAPRNAKTGQHASVTEASTWSTFVVAASAACPNGLGIGYVLTADDPYSCIDLDVKDSTTQPELDRYRQIVQDFDSYTEISRSGRGLHVIVEGKVGKGRRRDGVELYSQERFIICTGNALDNKPIADRSELLGRLVEQMGEGRPVPVAPLDLPATDPDRVIWRRASTARNGAKFISLCEGEWTLMGFPSQSEADLALMGMLTFYSCSNDQCRRMFRMTKLGQRAKATKNNRYVDGLLMVTRAGHEERRKLYTRVADEMAPGIDAAIAAHRSKWGGR